MGLRQSTKHEVVAKIFESRELVGTASQIGMIASTIEAPISTSRRLLSKEVIFSSFVVVDVVDNRLIGLVDEARSDGYFSQKRVNRLFYIAR